MSGHEASFYIETYGCQMNSADSALVEQLLLRAGFGKAAEAGEADVVLLNTCTVRGHAESRIYGRFRQLLALRGKRPHLVLGMLGCLAQHHGGKLFAELPFLDVVAGPDSYRRLPAMLVAALQDRRQPGRLLDVRLDRGETYADLPAGTELAGASGFVTIQRGCDRFCAYCIVPLVRGRERAVPPETVLRQVGEQLAAGRREVTLLGQTVNSYRHGETDFPTLLRQVARQPGLARLRFLSPYPAGFGEELCALFASEPGLMPQVHLPLQSGSTAVLARMGRQYSREEYLALVHRLRTACPGIALSTDVLVGFPGESEEQLEQTVALLEQVRFQSAYLYRYSERPGTRAAHRFPDDVPEEEKLRRLQRVIDVQEGITREILDGWCGKEVEVLVDGPSRRDRQAASGRSRENIPVVVTAAGAVRPGELLAASVVRSTGHTLLAEPVRHG